MKARPTMWLLLAVLFANETGRLFFDLLRETGDRTMPALDLALHAFVAWVCVSHALKDDDDDRGNYGWGGWW